MAKKMEEESQISDIDDSTEIELKEVPMVATKSKTHVRDINPSTTNDKETLINCLRNERIIIRHIPKRTGLVSNPKHILYGGMAESAVRVFVVPKLQSGMFVNVLTDSEKAFLEDVMGLEYNALSIYKKVDNYWDDSNESSIPRVRLTKQDNYLDLSNPEDYIRYKILLANKDYIAPSLKDLEDYPKATYQFVVISENDESNAAKTNMSTISRCYVEYGKVSENEDILKTIIETIDGRPVSSHTKLEFLQTRVNDLIQSDSKRFLRTILDPMLSTKVLIRKCIENGLISNRGNFLYLTKDSTPLCENNEEPVLSIAAKYLNAPKHQELKFMLEAKLKQ